MFSIYKAAPSIISMSGAYEERRLSVNNHPIIVLAGATATSAPTPCLLANPAM